MTEKACLSSLSHYSSAMVMAAPDEIALALGAITG
jgi:hypothetical protein